MQRTDLTPGLARVLIAGAACLLYLNTLTNQLVFDDLELITYNPLVRDPWNLGRIFTSSYWGSILHAGNYRPLTVWSLACNYGLNEGLGLVGSHVYGLHLVNIGLHAAASVALNWLLLRIGLSCWTSLTAALLFAVHPIHTEAVAGIVGRAECLAALWGILFLGLHRRRGRLLMANLAYLLAMLSKESGIAFFGLALWMDACFRNPVKPWPWKVYGSYLLTMGGWLLLRGYALRGIADTPSFLDNPLVAASLGERLLTGAGVQFEYLKLQAMPVSLSSDYSYAQTEVVSSMGDGRSAGFVAVILAATGLAWAQRRSLPVVPFAVAGYAILFSVTSNFLFPIGTVMGERLAYAPSMLVSLLLGYGLGQLRRRFRLWAWGGALALVAFWAVLTLARNRTWADAEVFHRTQLQSAPRSARAHFGLGKVHFDAGAGDSAVVYYRKALEVYPRYAEAWYNLGLARHQLGKLKEAADAYERAVVENRGLAEAWYNLGLARHQLGELKGAVDAYVKAAVLQPGDVAIWFNLGAALRRRGELGKALQAFQRVNQLQPGWAEGWYQTGRIYEELGNLGEAETTYERALSLEPGHPGVVRRIEALNGRRTREGLRNE